MPHSPPAQPASRDRQIVAAFDFDGTITRHDTLLPFLYTIAGPLGFSLRMLRESIVLLGYALGRIENDRAKESLLRRFLATSSFEDLQRRGSSFATNTIPRMLRSDAIDCLNWHLEQGHRCIVVSASLDLYVDPWARNAGFADVICSRLRLTDGRTVSGSLDGMNCYGEEKVRRLRVLLGDLDNYEIYAYGDSEGDLPLLREADHAFYKRFRK